MEEPPLSPVEAAQAAYHEARQRRDVARENKALVEELERTREQLAFASALREPVTPTIITRHSAGGGDAVACLVASDWHVEEPVEAYKIHGLNEFNLEVARQRAEHFWRNGLRLAEMMARETEIRSLWVGLLGDFISNYIHDELKQTNSLAPVAAARFAQGLLISGLDFLLRESGFNLVIDAVHGNHGRLTQKPQVQNSSETSLETFLYSAIAARYQDNPRVEFRIAEGKMLYRRFFEKFNMRIIHGDDVKFGGGVGGITIPIRKALAGWDKAVRADLTVMGHFHQRFDGGDFLVNGSLIGYNEFAQAIKASPEEAQQAFFLVHARHGGEKSIVAPIWLDDAHHREEAA